MRVMAVGAHPDDLEILCGGTLARYADLGHEVVMAHVLNGDKGHYEFDSEELARIRKKEAEAGTTLGRFGNPLEFGALVAFLVSEQSDYMTGTCIAIDGGALTTIT